MINTLFSIIHHKDVWLLYFAAISLFAIIAQAVFSKTKVSKANVSAFYVYDPRQEEIITIKKTANGERRHVIDIAKKTIKEVRRTA